MLLLIVWSDFDLFSLERLQKNTTAAIRWHFCSFHKLNQCILNVGFRVVVFWHVLVSVKILFKNQACSVLPTQIFLVNLLVRKLWLISPIPFCFKGIGSVNPISSPLHREALFPTMLVKIFTKSCVCSLCFGVNSFVYSCQF